MKCIACCVNLFVGLFLLIPQITKKQREPSLLSTPKETWDLCSKYIH